MERTIIEQGRITRLYMEKSENERIFGVQIFLGSTEEPSAYFDLTVKNANSAFKLFTTIETHVSELNGQFFLTGINPELAEVILNQNKME